jgi:hypothetical protein
MAASWSGGPARDRREGGAGGKFRPPTVSRSNEHERRLKTLDWEILGLVRRGGVYQPLPARFAGHPCSGIYMAARMRLATTMFVRFRQTPRRRQVSILKTRRKAGKVANEHVASLGSIALPMTVRGRQVFWAYLWEGLASLSDRIGADDQARIRNAVHERIPMVPPDEAAADAQAVAFLRGQFRQQLEDTVEG